MKSKHTILIVALVLGGSLLSGAASAQIYKWTDSEGRVHFGDSAPPDQKVDTVSVHESAKQDQAADVSEQAMMERQRRVTQALEEERLEKEKHQAEEKEAAAKKAAYCERFKNRLERLDSSSTVYSENPDGTVKYWKSEDADSFKVKKHQQYQQECGQS